MKLPRIQSDMSIIKRAFVLAVVYFLLFDTSILTYKYAYYKAGEMTAFVELFKESLYIIIMLFFSFLGFSINTPTFITYSVFLYATGAFVSYYTYAMKILPTKQMVKATLDVEFMEAYELVSTKMLAWVLFSLLICYFLLKRFTAKDLKNKVAGTLLFMFFILSIANIITPFYRVFNSYYPIQYLHNSYHYFLEKYLPAAKSDVTKTITD